MKTRISSGLIALAISSGVALATDAFLNVSTTQFGEVYLNGQKVLTDNLPG